MNEVAKQLIQIIESIESLEAQKKEIAEAIREVYANAGQQGFDTKIIRDIIKMRSLPDEKRKLYEEVLEHYKSMLGL